jgi:hypothetical protein
MLKKILIILLVLFICTILMGQSLYITRSDPSIYMTGINQPIVNNRAVDAAFNLSVQSNNGIYVGNARFVYLDINYTDFNNDGSTTSLSIYCASGRNVGTDATWFVVGGVLNFEVQGVDTVCAAAPGNCTSTLQRHIWNEPFDVGGGWSQDFTITITNFSGPFLNCEVTGVGAPDATTSACATDGDCVDIYISTATP